MTVKKAIKTAVGVMVLTAVFFYGCANKKAVPEVTGDFAFTLLKAGKADAIVLKTQNHSIVIDCGEKGDGDKVLKCLEDYGVSNVDYLFITHFDKDHVGGFPKLVKNISIGNIIVPDYEGSNKEYERYLEAVEENELAVTELSEDFFFVLDDVLFEVSAPKKQSYAEGDNDYSIVISAIHGENSFLFAGDAEEERLSELISELERGYDFLKVPHHGKYNNLTSRFINYINPSYAVICDSEKNPAAEETISALENAGCELYSTKDGDVSVLSDGYEIKITQ